MIHQSWNILGNTTPLSRCYVLISVPVRERPLSFKIPTVCASRDDDAVIHRAVLVDYALTFGRIFWLDSTICYLLSIPDPSLDSTLGAAVGAEGPQRVGPRNWPTAKKLQFPCRRPGTSSRGLLIASSILTLGVNQSLIVYNYFQICRSGRGRGC